jgi:Glutamine synthetase, beta-Grasp domain
VAACEAESGRRGSGAQGGAWTKIPQAAWQRLNGDTSSKLPLGYRSEAMVPNCTTAEDLLKAIKDEKIQMIDLRFTDLPGVWQHFSVPPSAVNIDALNEGIGFDGSSIRGFQEIQESDMLVVPDPTTAFADPYTPQRRWS